MSVLELLILAGLAAIVLYQLYAVLGRRVGRQPDENLPHSTIKREIRPQERDVSVPINEISGLLARDPDFEPIRFLRGARDAYETIIQAFTVGDRETLNRLVSPTVMASFEQAMQAREAEDRSEIIKFINSPRADLDRVETEGDIARARVRFLAEFRSYGKGPEGETIDDRRTAELWTFERHISSKDPNWILIYVDEAKA